MKIVIDVDPRHADGVRDFAADFDKMMNVKLKAIPHLTLTLYRANGSVELNLHRFKSVTVEGLPEVKIEPGDVVRHNETGNWGRVLSSSRGRLSVKASRETLKETGNETFVCRAENVEVLV